MSIHGYAVYGERVGYFLHVYVVSLWLGPKEIKSPWWWVRFNLKSAHAKGLLEMRRADRRHKP